MTSFATLISDYHEKQIAPCINSLSYKNLCSRGIPSNQIELMPLLILYKLQKLLLKQEKSLRFFNNIAMQSRLILLVIFFSLFSNLSFSQIGLRGTAGIGIVSATTITVNKPLGTTTGDLMIVNISTFGNNVAATRTGWTPIKSAFNNTTSTYTLLYKVVNASDAAITSYAFSLGTGGTAGAAAIVSFLGVDTLNPIDAAGTTISIGNNSAPTASTITTVTPKTALIMFGMAAGTGITNPFTWSNWNSTSPGVLTELYDQRGTSSSVGAAWAQKPTVSATGNGTSTTSTISNSTRWGAIMVALRSCTPKITTQPTTPVTACIGGTSPTLSLVANGMGTLSYQWYSNTTNTNTGGIAITGASTSNYPAPVVTAGTKYYYAVVTGSCGKDTSAVVTVNVNNNNTATLTSVIGTNAQTLCINTAITPITYATTGATGATVTGLPTGVNGSWAANVVTISGTPSVTGPFNYTVTLTGGCGTITTTGTINVTPNNTITLSSGAGSNIQSICFNNAINNISYNTTGATNATITGLPLGVTGSWSANVITISGTPTVIGSFNYTISLSGGCGNISTSGTITVNGNNTIALNSAAGTDAQIKCISTPITNITYSTTFATGAAVTGLPAGVSGSWAANVVTISGTPTVAGIFNYTVNLTGGCGIASATGSINVTANNTVTLTSATGTNTQSICINTPATTISYATTGATNATVTGLPTGVTGSWAGNVVTISGTPTTSGIFNYTVTLTGGCGAIIATGSLNVGAINTIALTSAAGTNAQTRCINTPVTNITYSTTGATGATITGLPTGVTGSWAANVVTISGTPTVSGAFTYNINLTGGCGTTAVTGTITVNVNNTVALTSAAGSNIQTLCINTPISAITYATTGATNATVSGLPTGVTGSWAANVFTISGTPTTSGVFNYIVTLTGGCGTITANGTINVTANNTITLSSAAGTNTQIRCINTAITNITYTTSGATDVTISGLPLGVTGSWAGNVVTISGTPTVLGVSNYTITLTGGCGNITTTGSITVNANNTISLTSAAGTNAQTRCNNTAITNITYSTTGATAGTVSGLPTGVTGTWAANVVTITGTPSVAGTFNYTVNLTGGCGIITATGSIIVTPNNTIALSSAAGTITQTKCINTAITDITYNTTGATNATITGLPLGVTGSWSANVFTITGTPTVSGISNYTITLTGGCGTITATGSITVTANNTITLTSAAGSNTQTRCINTAITNITYSTTGATAGTVSGLPTGVTGTWAANVVTIAGTPSLAGTFNYTVNLTGGCGTITATGTLDVSANNTIALTSAAGSNIQTICINTPATTVTYATTGATGATITGLPAGITGSWAANVVTISGTPSASGTFNYIVTLTGGCGTITATGTITVRANNTINLSSAAGTNAQTRCINTAITNITYTTSGATNATITGLPLGVTGSWAGNVVTISGTPTETGTFNYTITLTGGCATITASGTITVNANNTIALTSAAGTNIQTRCISTPLTTITYSTTGATGATVSGLPAGVTGVWAANVVTISGTPTATGTFNYTVTLTGGCSTIAATGTIIVTANNTVTLTSAAGTNAQTRCINTAITNITYTTTGATNASITGLPLGVTGSWAANVITISGSPTVAGVANYTITLTGGCGTITTTGSISVTANNTITLTSAAGTDAQTRCINTALTTISYSTARATGATVTGLPTGVTGSWAGNVVTISGTPTVAGSFTYTITLTGGCGTITTTGSITVTANNTIALTSAAGSNIQTVCINRPIVNITYATTGATGANFTGLPAGVTGSWLANVITISGTPTTAATSNFTITLTGGCGNITSTGTITVTANNTITLSSAASTAAQIRCINTAITNITYTTVRATGATFTGLPTGVNGSWAGNVVTISGTPSVAGVFNYTVTLTGGCGTITATGSITVNAINTVTLTSGAGSNIQSRCTNNPITNITYTTTGATNVTFSGLPAGVTGTWSAGNATISGSPTSLGTFNYTVTLTGGCGTLTATGTLTISANTVITTQPVASFTLCPGGTITLTAAASGTGNTYQWRKDGVNIPGATGVTYTKASAVLADAGTYTFTVTNGCGTLTSQNSVVSFVSGVSVNIVADYCVTPVGRIKLTAVVSPTAAASGFTYSWSNGGIRDTTFVTIAGTYSVTVTPTAATTSSSGCSGTATASIVVSQELAPNGNFELGNVGFTVPSFFGVGYQYYVDSPNFQRELIAPGRYGVGTNANNYNVSYFGKDHTTGTGNFLVARGFSFLKPMIWEDTVAVTPNTNYYFSGWAMALDSNVLNLPILRFLINGRIVGNPLLLPPHGQSLTAPDRWQRFYVTWNSGTATSATFSIYDSIATTRGNSFGLDDISIGTLSPFITLTSSPATDTQTVCVNRPIVPITFRVGSGGAPVVTGLPAGVSFTFINSILTISGSPTVGGTFNYTVSTSGCSVRTFNGQIISVSQNISLTSAAGTNNQSFCIGNTITPITYTLLGSATAPTVTGLPNGVTSAFVSGTLTITGTPLQSGAFTYTITNSAGTCTGATSVTGNITVNALPIITINADSCSIAGSLVLTAVPQIAGVHTYLWSNGNTTDNITTSVSGTYSVTVTNANGCVGTQSIVVSIGSTQTSPTPTTNFNACLSTAITNITYSAGGNLISYNATGLPTGLIATFNAGVITISGSPTQLGTFNYTLTVVTSLCRTDLPVTSTFTGSIIVNPNPTVTIAADFCAVNNRIRLTATPAPLGTYTYLWSSGSTRDTALVTTGGNFTVTATNAVGCKATATYSINTEIALNGDFSLGNTGFASVSTGNITAYNFITDSANYQGELVPVGYYGVDTNVNNYNLAYFGHDHTTGTGKFMMVHGYPFLEPIAWQQTLPVVPNTTYYFTGWALGLDSTGNNASIGLSVNGNQVGNNVTLTNHGLSPLAPDNWRRFYATWNSGANTTGIFRISNTPSGFFGNGFGLDDISIGTISPFITLTSSPATDTQYVCLNAAIQPVRLSYGSGGTPTVTGLPAGVTMTVTNNTITISGTPTVAGIYNYTVSTAGCNIKRFFGQISAQTTNLALASAAGTNNQAVCINNPITNIVYTAVPTVTGVTITGLPAGVSFVFNAGILTISGTPTVSGTFNYTITNTGVGCSAINTYTGTITVRVSPTVNITLDYCAIPGSVRLRAVPTPAGTHTFSWSTGRTTDTSTVATSGTYTVTVTNSVGCITTASVNVTIGILLSSAAGTNNQNVCLGDTARRITYSTASNITGITITGLPAGVTFTYASNIITISGTPTVAGNYPYTINSTVSCGTPPTATGTINVSAKPTVRITADYCSVPGSIKLRATVTPAGTYTYLWSNGTTRDTTLVNVAGIHSVRVTNAAGCIGTASIQVGLELAENGNFDLGNVGFNTPLLLSQRYLYVADSPNIRTELRLPGLYGIGTNANNYNDSYQGRDHTTGSGNFQIVHGIPFVPIPNWEKTITVSPNTIYYFTAWAQGLDSLNNNPILRFTINNVQVGTNLALTNHGQSPTSPDNWTRFYTTWNSGASTQASFAITDIQNFSLGNSFGLDDISIGILSPFITLVSPPSTDTQTVCLNAPIDTVIIILGGDAIAPVVNGLPPGVTYTFDGYRMKISGAPTVLGVYNYSVSISGCAPKTFYGQITAQGQSLVLTSAANSNNQSVCIGSPMVNIVYSTGGNISASAVSITGLPAGVTFAVVSGIITISGVPTLTGSFPYTVTVTGGICSTTNTTVTATGTIGIIDIPTILILSDYCTYPGRVKLKAVPTPAGTYTYYWNNGSTADTTIVDLVGTYTITINNGNGCSASNSISVSTELVVNGNFEQGNVGFTSPPLGTQRYIYVPDSANYRRELYPSGRYGIGKNANFYHDLYWGRDHTTGNGNFMVVHGFAFATPILWQQTVPVTPNTNYYFSGWGMSLNGLGFNGRLRFSINSTQVGTTLVLPNRGNSDTSANNWSRFYTVWNSGTATSAVLAITNSQTSIIGNSFGVDDISFASMSPFINLVSSPSTDTQTVCINTPITTVSLNVGSGGSVNVTGLPPGVTFTFNGYNLQINGTPTALGTFNYVISLSSNCAPRTFNGQIIVSGQTIALSSAVGTNAQTKCINTPITNITYTTGGATTAAVTGLPTGVTSTLVANTLTISGTPSVAGIFNYMITLTSSCGVVRDSGTITVTPNNTITLSSAAGTNTQTICINTPLTNIQYATTGATGATFTGLPAGVTGVWATDTATISGTPTVAGVFNYTITLTGGCGIITTTGTITVSANNTITLSSAAGTNAQTKCINTPITNITYTTINATGATFDGLPLGVTGSWAANIVTISGTPTEIGTFNYTITLTGGCGTTTTTGTITIRPDNTIALSSAAETDSQTLCINTPLTNITYSTVDATGASFSGLPTGVTGTWAANTVTISGTPTVAGTFNYIVTLTGGCGTVTAIGVINVTANNTITLSSAAGTNAQAACINTPITNITYTTVGATGATFSGLPTGVSGSWADDTVTISGTPRAGGTYNYTITLTGGCGVTTTTGTITVRTDNVILLNSAAGTDAQIKCINTALTNITYATIGATGATITGLPAGITGTWVPNVVTISGTPIVAGTFNYIITLTGGCGVVADSGTITVTPNNTINLSSAVGTNAQTICINTPLTNIQYATTGATGATFTGLPAGVTGTWSADTVTLSGTPTVAGAFNYTITLTGGCGVITTTGTITVSANNTITLSSAAGTNAQTKCINTAITNITYATTGATGATIIGLPLGVTDSWAANVFTISGTPTETGTFNYTITLTGGCGTTTTTGTITIRPENTITLSSAAETDSQTLCINTPLTTITYSTVSATGATFSGLPTGVTGTWAANTVTISGTPTVAGTFNYIVTLTGGCGTITATGTINVTPNNTITLSSAAGTNAQTACINTPITNITYTTTGAIGATFTGLPAGVTGTWAANAVTISGTSTATGTFNYIVTLTGGCGIITTTGSIVVAPSNTLTLTSAAGSLNQAICINNPISNITLQAAGNVTGVTATGLPTGLTTNYIGGILTISGTPTQSGVFNFTATTTVSNCAVATISGTLTINTLPTVTITNSPSSDISCSSLSITLTASGGTSYNWNGGLGNTPSIVVTNSGNYSVVVTNTAGCVNSGSIAITNSVPPNESTWLGNNADWSDASNWCGGIPNAIKNVIIPTGVAFTPVINPGTNAICANITINAGATLSINNTSTLTALGNFINNGTLTNNGKIELAGTTNQSFPGPGTITDMDTLQINNTAGITLNKSIDIAKELRPTSGILSLGNFDITMKSNAVATASVSAIGASAGFNYGTGRFIIERYIATGTGAGQHGKSWQFITAPVVGAQTVKQAWQENASIPNQNPNPGYGTQIAGEFANALSLGFDVRGNVPSMKTYDATTNTFIGIPNTISYPIQNSKGFMIFVRGNRNDTSFTQAANPTTLRAKGTIYGRGVDAPPVISITSGGYQTIGNPYPSAIDFSNTAGVVFNRGANIDNAFYVWDPTLAGSNNLGGYQTMSATNNWIPVPGGTTYYPTGIPSPMIQSGQAFFMHATGTGGTVSFNESAKTSGSSLVNREFSSTNNTTDKQYFETKLYNNNGILKLADGNLLVLSNDYANEFNADDAIKLTNTSENFGIKSNGKLLAVEARQSISTTDTLTFNATNLRIGNYKLSFTPSNLSATGLTPYLIDQHLQTSTMLSFTDTATYDFSVNSSSSSSYAANRFMIVFRNMSTLPVNFTHISASRKASNKIQINWGIAQESGISFYILEKSTDGQNFTGIQQMLTAMNNGLSANYQNIDTNELKQDLYYRIKAINFDGSYLLSRVARVKALDIVSSIQLYPNPVIHKKLFVKTSGLTQGIYHADIYSNNGQLVFSKTINIQQIEQTTELLLPKTIASGNYLFNLKMGNDVIEAKEMLIK